MNVGDKVAFVNWAWAEAKGIVEGVVEAIEGEVHVIDIGLGDVKARLTPEYLKPAPVKLPDPPVPPAPEQPAAPPTLPDPEPAPEQPEPKRFPE